MNDSVGLVGKNVEISGEINFEGTLRIEGKMKGFIHGNTGTVSIGNSGFVKGDISADICIVDGILEGDLIAMTRVKINKTGQIKGNVTTKELVIAEGAVLAGSLVMDKETTIPLEKA